MPLNEFEQAVFDALTARGVKLLPQYGTSCYRIDMVAMHPRQEGRFVLAIECDGATYHSAPTARDRDRLRQQHLEALGWHFHRIWSTDWFMRPRGGDPSRSDGIPACGRSCGSPGRRAVTAFDAKRRANVPGGVPLGNSSQQRSPRPSIFRKDTIAIIRCELRRLVKWILEGELLTDDEVVDRAVRELGFQRRGSRIEAAIRRVIPEARTGAR